MKKYEKQLVIVVSIICTLVWILFAYCVIENCSKAEASELKINGDSSEFLQNKAEGLLNEDKEKYDDLIEMTEEIKEQKRLTKIEEDKRKLEEERRLAEQKKLKEEAEKQDTYTMRISHFSAQCKSCSGITKSGVDVRNTVYYQGYRIIAVDPNVIPLWSIVEMELPTGNVKAIALDTGGKIKKFKVDFLVSSTKEAYKLGVYKNVKVTVIRKGKG